MATALSTIQTRLSVRLKDTSDVTNAQYFQMATDLNQFLYNEMFGEDPERFIDSNTSYTVTSSPSTQALPSDFRDVTEWGCGFFPQDSNGDVSREQLTLTGYGSKRYGYYINGTNVVFTGINDSKTVVLRYVPVLADITAVSGTFVTPDENKELLTEGMVLYYYRYEEDPRESDQDMRFKRLLDLFIEGLLKTPKVFLTPSPTGGGYGVNGVRNDIPIYY